MEAYAKAQGLWQEDGAEDPVFTDSLELDLSTVVPSIAGPKRPQDRIELKNASMAFASELSENFKPKDESARHAVKGKDFTVGHGDLVIAAITSCTNTSNPSVMIAAGLVAQKANALGLKVKPWVKTSLAPGSQVVTEYLTATGLQSELDSLGYNLVGYGCTCLLYTSPSPRD